MSQPAPARLVVQTSFIGDMVLTTPLLEYLASHGDGPVDVLAIPSSAPLLSNNPHVRDVLVFDKRGKDSGARGFVRLAGMLRSRAYGIAYFAQGSVRSAALGVAARIPRRVGFDTSAGRHFYTERVRYDETAHHAVRLLTLAHADVAAAPKPALFPGDAERTAVDDLLRDAGYSGEPLVALAPGSVWATKRWPFYAPLAAQLSPSFRTLIIGSRNDAPTSRRTTARP